MTFQCGIQTRPARMYEDPEPAEYCENEVDVEGEPCASHAEPDDDYDDDRRDEEIDRRLDLAGTERGAWDE